MDTDAAVIERLAADTRRGFPDFVRAHAGLVFTVALRCSGSRTDAEDLSQECFMRAYRALSEYPPARIRDLKPRPWLASIVTNLWRNEVRRRTRRPLETPLVQGGRSRRGDGGLRARPMVDGPQSGEPGPEEVVVIHESSEELATLLLGLPEHERVALVLRHVAGIGYAEISEALDCPVGTVKARVHRGLRRLDRAMDDKRVDAAEEESA